MIFCCLNDSLFAHLNDEFWEANGKFIVNAVGWKYIVSRTIIQKREQQQQNRKDAASLMEIKDTTE